MFHSPSLLLTLLVNREVCWLQNAYISVTNCIIISKKVCSLVISIPSYFKLIFRSLRYFMYSVSHVANSFLNTRVLCCFGCVWVESFCENYYLAVCKTCSSKWEVTKCEAVWTVIPLEKRDSEPDVLSLAVKLVDMASEESTNTCSQSAKQEMQSPNTWKFKEECCNECKWLKFDHSTSIADVRLVLWFPICSKKIWKLLRDFMAPFKLETFKQYDKSFLLWNVLQQRRHLLLKNVYL
jgi:hypothetical protein